MHTTHEVNLIPSDYARYLRNLDLVKTISAITAGFVILAVLGYSVLLHNTHAEQRQIRDLQTQKAISTQQNEMLQNLKQERSLLEQEWNLLQQLRGGASAQAMFWTMERALNGVPMWFRKWEFRRAGTVTEKPLEGVNTGYIIVLPQGEAAQKPSAWQIETHMQISGQTRDYETLSGFVNQLYEQPEIVNVRVLKTALRRYTNVNVVDFELAIIVNNKLGAAG